MSEFDVPVGALAALKSKMPGAKFAVDDMVTLPATQNSSWTGSQDDLREGIQRWNPQGTGKITAVIPSTVYTYVVNGKKYSAEQLTKKMGGRRHTRSRRRASRRDFRV
jgi:hypothetical protein